MLRQAGRFAPFGMTRGLACIHLASRIERPWEGMPVPWGPVGGQIDTVIRRKYATRRFQAVSGAKEVWQWLHR